MWEFEARAREEGFSVLCGVDEAGRGPLAGPVFATAVILPFGLEIPGLNDSKKLSPQKRDELFTVICEKAVSFGIASADEAEIDEINILQASMLAMRRAVETLAITPDLALVDGNRAPKLPCAVRTIVKGDAKSASIAAASILAKVSRDRVMLRFAEQYPEYEFERHKGYPTALHYEKLLQYGPCPIHRQSFLRKFYERNGRA